MSKSVKINIVIDAAYMTTYAISEYLFAVFDLCGYLIRRDSWMQLVEMIPNVKV